MPEQIVDQRGALVDQALAVIDEQPDLQLDARQAGGRQPAGSFGDRRAQPLAMAEQRDAELLQVRIVELGQQVGRDALRGKLRRVLGQADALQPIGNLPCRVRVVHHPA